MPDLARIQDSFTCAYHRTVRYNSAEIPADLLTLLRATHPHIPASAWDEYLWWGAVYLNGKRVQHNEPLPTPCKVEFYEPRFPIAEAKGFFSAWDPRFLLYQDEFLAVVYKPPKLPSLPAREQCHFSLRRSLENHFSHPVHMPSRLDMSAQGLLVVSLHPRMHKPLQRLYELRTIHKHYVFETTGKSEWESYHLDAAIDKDPAHPVLRRVVQTGGQSAQTDFRRVALQFTELSPHEVVETALFEAKPLTGRTHQIRVHAAHLGLPIIGDNFYDGFPVQGLRLLSYRVRFSHPFSQQAIDVRLPNDLLPTWATAVGTESPS